MVRAKRTVADFVGTSVAELVALVYLSPIQLDILLLSCKAFDCTFVLHVAHVEL